MNVVPSKAMAALSLRLALHAGVTLDRGAVRHLRKMLERLGSEMAGAIVMQAQLKAVLDRRDWTVISLRIDPATVRETGVSIGIVEVKTRKGRKG